MRREGGRLFRWKGEKKGGREGGEGETVNMYSFMKATQL